MLTIDNVYRAGKALKNVIRKTDVIYAPKLKPGVDLYLKTEKALRSRLKAISQRPHEKSLRMLAQRHLPAFTSDMKKSLTILCS